MFLSKFDPINVPFWIHVYPWKTLEHLCKYKYIYIYIYIIKTILDHPKLLFLFWITIFTTHPTSHFHFGYIILKQSFSFSTNPINQSQNRIISPTQSQHHHHPQTQHCWSSLFTQTHQPPQFKPNIADLKPRPTPIANNLVPRPMPRPTPPDPQPWYDESAREGGREAGRESWFLC